MFTSSNKAFFPILNVTLFALIISSTLSVLSHNFLMWVLMPHSIQGTTHMCIVSHLWEIVKADALCGRNCETTAETAVKLSKISKNGSFFSGSVI